MRLSVTLLGCLAALAAPAAVASPGAPAPPRVLAIEFDTDVNPVTQGWLNSELGRAESGHYAAAVILLDTPGGYESSMQLIVEKELALSSAGVPVIVYVTPGGAHAASAGVWISEAADVLAMAPETNIGSSTPILSTGANIGSDLRRKAINDAAASLRGLAASHGRNAAWANAAVRVASNLTAAEALHMHVIDLVAPTLSALLNEIDGTTTVPAASSSASFQRCSTRTSSRCSSSPESSGSPSSSSTPASCCRARSVPSRSCSRSSASRRLSVSTTGLLLVGLGVALLVLDAHAHAHGALTARGLVALGFGLVESVPEHARPLPHLHPR